MKRAFTLLELLVVIAIMGLIATLTMVSIRNARARSRDTARIANIDTLKKSLELYFNAKGEYPQSGEASDCNGGTGLVTALQPLVDERLINEIPHDAYFPNNAHPFCFYYIANSACGTGDNAHPYVMVISTETLTPSLPSWNNEPRRYCVYP